MNSLNNIFTNLKKNPKQMIIVISSAVLLSLFVCIVFVFKPQIVNISGVRARLSKINADLKGARSDIARIGVMKDTVDSYKKKIGLYEKTLPTEDGIPGLLESLSGMAKSANMRIAGIVPIIQKKPEAGNRAYEEIPITITAQAGYHELGRFLASLENSDRFMKVTDIQIKADKASPKKHDVELLVVTYVLLEGK